MIYRARMFFAVAAGAVLLQALLQASQPNIVLIVSDDQGWNDVSYHGGAIPTPNIDRIAQEGVQLERYYACPVCTPTRAGLMTGRYPIRFGMQRAVCRPFLKVGVPPAEETLPEMLGRAGYRYRGAAGKWHIGHAFRKYHPLNQGFNFYIGHYNGNIDYFTHFREGELDWHRGFEANFDEGYSTDLIADAAVDYIDRRAGDGPFFLYVPFNAPHTPFQVPDKWLPPFAQVENEKRRIYMAMVAALDAAVGRILEAIDRNGLTGGTLVWFASDNGGFSASDNSPLRAGKGTVYEGGIRVVSALRWPNGIPGGGRKVSGAMSYLDVWPTLRRVAGLGAAGGPGEPLDGEDMFDVIAGRRDPAPRAFYSYYERYGDEQLALIDGDWKIVRRGPPILGPNPADAPPAGHRSNLQASKEPTVELFNIRDDPHEERDLARRQIARVRRMIEQLKEFRALREDGGVPPMTAPAPADWKAPKHWTPAVEE